MSHKELIEAVIIHLESLPYFDSEERFMYCDCLLDIFPAGLVTTWKILGYSNSSSSDNSYSGSNFGIAPGNIEDEADGEDAVAAAEVKTAAPKKAAEVKHVSLEEARAQVHGVVRDWLLETAGENAAAEPS